jgi:hypothetical protein
MSQAPRSVYPDNIRAAANATKLNNQYTHYRNSDSGMSHTNLRHASPESMHSGYHKDFLSYKKMKDGSSAVLKFIV